MLLCLYGYGNNKTKYMDDNDDSDDNINSKNNNSNHHHHHHHHHNNQDESVALPAWPIAIPNLARYTCM